MIHVLTVPSSTYRQEYIKSVMHLYDITDWRFHEGVETKKRFDGLFDSIKEVIKQEYDQPYAIIFEDDISPTEYFSFEALQDSIKEGEKLEAHILLGGIKEYCFKVGDRLPLTKVHNYRGSQLMVIYKRFYDEILKTPSGYREFELFSSHHGGINKFVTLPFLAYQADFPSRFLTKSEHKQDYINCENQLING